MTSQLSMRGGGGGGGGGEGGGMKSWNRSVFNQHDPKPRVERSQRGNEIRQDATKPQPQGTHIFVTSLCDGLCQTMGILSISSHP